MFSINFKREILNQFVDSVQLNRKKLFISTLSVHQNKAEQDPSNDMIHCLGRLRVPIVTFFLKLIWGMSSGNANSSKNMN